MRQDFFADGHIVGDVANLLAFEHAFTAFADVLLILFAGPILERLARRAAACPKRFAAVDFVAVAIHIAFRAFALSIVARHVGRAGDSATAAVVLAARRIDARFAAYREFAFGRALAVFVNIFV